VASVRRRSPPSAHRVLRPILPVTSFAGQCAALLTTAGKSRSGSPVSYTPKHLAKRILASKSALEGERKQVTVLFVDLKGSMELLPPAAEGQSRPRRR
jgi:hypothetical protein